VGGNGALVELVAQRYREAGVERVESKLYAEARHELLNETNREEVTRDFLRWARRALR
jgi:alpha-beta hydrolase superfamily lysophospholipase